MSPPAWALVSLFLAPALVIDLLSPPIAAWETCSSLCNQCVTTDLRSPMQNLSSIIAGIRGNPLLPKSVICNLRSTLSLKPVQPRPRPEHWQYWALGPFELLEALTSLDMRCSRQIGSGLTHAPHANCNRLLLIIKMNCWCSYAQLLW